MQVRPAMLLLILGMGLVTVVPRVLPLVTLSRVRLPASAERWLAYVPVAVISALLAVEVLVVDDRVSAPDAGRLLPVVAVVAVALWRRSLVLSVTAGIVTAAVLQLL